MKTCMLGSVTVGDAPKIVGTVSDEATLSPIARRGDPPCDIIELRIDLMRPGGDDWMRESARIVSMGIPVILTIRTPGEGGQWKGSAADRNSLFLKAAGSVSAMDLEIEEGIPPGIRESAARHGVRLIVSHHDFMSTPPLEDLLAVAANARAAGADIVKIATMVKSKRDLETLRSLAALAGRETPVCIIGMGPLGAETRLSPASIGSALTYAYLDRPVAPGQLSCAEIRASLLRD